MTQREGPLTNRAGRSLVCSFCSRRFARAEHLQRHSRTHTKEKPYVCHCKKSFSRRDLLKRHELLAHDATATSSPSCPQETIQSSDHGTLENNSPSPSTLCTPDISDGSDIHGSHVNSGLTMDNEAFLGYQGFPDNGFSDALINLEGFLHGVGLDLDTWNDTIDWNEDQTSATSVSNTEVTSVHNNPAADHGPQSIADSTDEGTFNELKPLNLPWKVSEEQRVKFSCQIFPFADVLQGFVLPSRFSLSRYIAGFVDGLNNHFPFVHMPTFSLDGFPRAPEMVLALAAIGAQYRYERKSARALYDAGRNIINERIRSGQLFPLLSSDSQSNSPLDLMTTARAILFLGKYCSWSADTRLLAQSMEYREILARCIRQDGLVEPPHVDPDIWAHWARIESDRRTKLSIYCFLNLQDTVYNLKPLVLGNEIDLRLPSSGKTWFAPSEVEWRASRACDPSPISFRLAFRSLLSTSNGVSSLPLTTPFANLILVHSLIQRMSLARQLALQIDDRSLQPSVTSELSVAFDRWRRSWIKAPETVLDALRPRDSLSFASTSLFALAQVRLYFDMSHLHQFHTYDPVAIATAAFSAPSPGRGSHLLQALLHATHSLDVPVQLGVKYLSQCHVFFWSVQHSFCSFECSVFLSKWLQMLAREISSQPLSQMELRIVTWLLRIIEEGNASLEGALLPTRDTSEARSQVKMVSDLSLAVIKLLAQQLQDSNTAWPIVTVIGKSLDIYATMLVEETRP